MTYDKKKSEKFCVPIFLKGCREFLQKIGQDLEDTLKIVWEILKKPKKKLEKFEKNFKIQYLTKIVKKFSENLLLTWGCLVKF